jgi:hypothetical protein
MAGSNTRPEGELKGVLSGYPWAEYLIAILAGNIIYLFIEPRLPAALQHHLFRVDLGLGVDFVICAAAYGLVHQLRVRREDRSAD